VGGHLDVRVQRHTDAAVADEMAAGRFPAGDALRDIRLHVEAAVHLADIAENDPETVYVVGCSREIPFQGEPGMGGYLVLGRATRTMSRPDQRVSLIVASGVLREEALARLSHIRAHVAALPAGAMLVPGDQEHAAEPDSAARLEAARRILLEETGSFDAGELQW
jgi:hypothetical protein